jgi:hypothetical protein
MLGCPSCGYTRLLVLIVIPGGDVVQCASCGERTEYDDLVAVNEPTA